MYIQDLDSLSGDERKIFAAFENVFGSSWEPQTEEQAWKDIHAWTNSVLRQGYHFDIDCDAQTVNIYDADGERSDDVEIVSQKALQEMASLEEGDEESSRPSMS